MCALVQGTIGLQHAAMAIYQAYQGNAPMLILAGRDDKHFLQPHTADDIAGLVRPYTKWDAHPETLKDTLDAIQEAYRQTITPPLAPVLVILDSEVQREEAGDLEIPNYVQPVMPGGCDSFPFGQLGKQGVPRLF